MDRTFRNVEDVEGRLQIVHLCLLLSDPFLHHLQLLGLPLLSPHLLSQDSLHPSKELQASVEVEVGALVDLGERFLTSVEHLHDLLGEGLADGEGLARGSPAGEAA